MFSMVEIEINSRCNRRCSYCPNSIAPRDAPRLMTREAFEEILERLSASGFAGRMSYHFYNEPLLHPNIVEFVSTATQRLPEVRQVLYSNGDYLTREKYEALLEAGIERFILTQHDGQPGPQWPHIEWLTPQLLQLTSRGGIVEAGPDASLARSIPCFAPSTMLVITITGNVVLCYEDAREENVMGNVFETPIADIWNGERFRRVRDELAAGNRSVVSKCEGCNNRAHSSSTSFDYVL